MSKVSRLEVIQTGARRRWSLDEKRRIVAESESGPRQLSATARRYGLSPSLLFTWRKLARKGRLGGGQGVTFAPAVIACEPVWHGAGSQLGERQGIEIVLADGLRMVVDQAIDPGLLARVVGALERR
jgi:transposase